MQVATTIDGDTGMVVKRLSVPIGLEELMESLTKQVLMKKPKDLFLFASEHFAHLVAIREKLNANQKNTENAGDTKQLKVKSITSGTKFNKLPTPVVFTNSKTPRTIATPKTFRGDEKQKKTRFTQQSLIKDSQTSLRQSVTTQKERAKWKKQAKEDVSSQAPPKRTPREIREAYTFRRDDSKARSRDRSERAKVQKAVEVPVAKDGASTRRDTTQKSRATSKITPRTKSTDSASSGISVHGKGISKSTEKLTKSPKKTAKVAPLVAGVVGGAVGVAGEVLAKSRSKNRSKGSGSESGGTSDMSDRSEKSEENQDSLKSKRDSMEGVNNKETKRDVGKIDESDKESEENVEDKVIDDNIDQGSISGSVVSNVVIGNTQSDEMDIENEDKDDKTDERSLNTDDGKNTNVLETVDDEKNMENYRVIKEDIDNNKDRESNEAESKLATIPEDSKEAKSVKPIEDEKCEEDIKELEVSGDGKLEEITEEAVSHAVDDEDTNITTENKELVEEESDKKSKSELVDETVKNILVSANKHEEEVKEVLLADNMKIEDEGKIVEKLKVAVEQENEENVQKQNEHKEDQEAIGENGKEDKETKKMGLETDVETKKHDKAETLTVDGKVMTVPDNEVCTVVDSEVVDAEESKANIETDMKAVDNKQEMEKALDETEKYEAPTGSVNDVDGTAKEITKQAIFEEETKDDATSLQHAADVVEEQLRVLNEMDVKDASGEEKTEIAYNVKEESEKTKVKEDINKEIQKNEQEKQIELVTKNETNEKIKNEEEPEKEGAADVANDSVDHGIQEELQVTKELHQSISAPEFVTSTQENKDSDDNEDASLATIAQTPSAELSPREYAEQSEEYVQRESKLDDDGPLSIEDLSNYLKQKDANEQAQEQNGDESENVDNSKDEKTMDKNVNEERPTTSVVFGGDVQPAIAKEEEDLALHVQNKTDSKAAIKIQSAWRGHQTRKRVEQMRKTGKTDNDFEHVFEPEAEDERKIKAATVIQAFAKGHLVRKHVQLAKNIIKKEEIEDEKHENLAAMKEENAEHNQDLQKQDGNELSEEIFSKKSDTSSDKSVDAYIKLSDSIDKEIKEVLEKLENVSVPDDDPEALHDRMKRSLDFNLEDVKADEVVVHEEIDDVAEHVSEDVGLGLHDIQEENEDAVKDSSEEVTVPIKVTKDFVEYEKKNYDNSPQVSPTINIEEIKEAAEENGKKIDEQEEIITEVSKVPTEMTKNVVDFQKENYVTSPVTSPRKNEDKEDGGDGKHEGVIAGALGAVGGFLATQTSNLKTLLSPRKKSGEKREEFKESLTKIDGAGDKVVESIRIRLKDNSEDAEDVDDDQQKSEDIAEVVLNENTKRNKSDEVDDEENVQAGGTDTQGEVKVIEKVHVKEVNNKEEKIDKENEETEEVPADLISATQNFVEYEKENYVNSPRFDSEHQNEEALPNLKNTKEEAGHVSLEESTNQPIAEAIGAAGSFIATQTNNSPNLLSAEFKTLEETFSKINKEEKKEKIKDGVEDLQLEGGNSLDESLEARFEKLKTDFEDVIVEVVDDVKEIKGEIKEDIDNEASEIKNTLEDNKSHVSEYLKNLKNDINIESANNDFQANLVDIPVNVKANEEKLVNIKNSADQTMSDVVEEEKCNLKDNLKAVSQKIEETDGDITKVDEDIQNQVDDVVKDVKNTVEHADNLGIEEVEVSEEVSKDENSRIGVVNQEHNNIRDHLEAVRNNCKNSEDQLEKIIEPKITENIDETNKYLQKINDADKNNVENVADEIKAIVVKDEEIIKRNLEDISKKIDQKIGEIEESKGSLEDIKGTLDEEVSKVVDDINTVIQKEEENIKNNLDDIKEDTDENNANTDQTLKKFENVVKETKEALNTFEKTVDAEVSELVNDVNSVVSKKEEDIRDNFKNISREIEQNDDVVDDVNKIINNGNEDMSNNLEDVSNKIEVELGETADTLENIQKEVNAEVSNLVINVDNLNTVSGKIEETKESLAATMSDVGEELKDVVELENYAIKDKDRVIEDENNSTNKLADKVTENVHNLTSEVDDVLTKVENDVKDNLENVSDLAQRKKRDTNATVENLKEDGEEVREDTFGVAESLEKVIPEEIKDSVEETKTLEEALKDTLEGATKTNSDNTKEIPLEIDRSSEKLKETSSDVQDSLQKVAEDIKEEINKLSETIDETISEKTENIEVVKSIITEVSVPNTHVEQDEINLEENINIKNLEEIQDNVNEPTEQVNNVEKATDKTDRNEEGDVDNKVKLVETVPDPKNISEDKTSKTLHSPSLEETIQDFKDAIQSEIEETESDADINEATEAINQPETLDQIIPTATPHAEIPPYTAQSIEEEEPPVQMSQEPIVNEPDDSDEENKSTNVDILIIDDDYESPVEIIEEEDKEEGEEHNKYTVDDDDHIESRKLIDAIKEELHNIKTIIEEGDEGEENVKNNKNMREIDNDDDATGVVITEITDNNEEKPLETEDINKDNVSLNKNMLDVSDLGHNVHMGRLISHDSSTSLDSVATVVLTEDLNKFREESAKIKVGVEQNETNNDSAVETNKKEKVERDCQKNEMNTKEGNLMPDQTHFKNTNTTNKNHAEINEEESKLDENANQDDVIVIDATQLSNHNADDIKFLAGFVNAATKIQSAFRGFRVRKPKAHKDNEESNIEQTPELTETKEELNKQPTEEINAVNEENNKNGDEKTTEATEKKGPSLGQFLKSLTDVPKPISKSSSVQKDKETEEQSDPNNEEEEKIQGTENDAESDGETSPSTTPFYLHNPYAKKIDPIANAIKMSSELTNREANIKLLHSGEFHDLYEKSERNLKANDAQMAQESKDTKATPPAGAEGSVTTSTPTSLPTASVVVVASSASSAASHPATLAASSGGDVRRSVSAARARDAGARASQADPRENAASPEAFQPDEGPTRGDEAEGQGELDSAGLDGVGGGVSGLRRKGGKQQVDETAPERAAPDEEMDPRRNNAIVAERNAESQAATKIQASFRGYQVRKQMQKPKNGNDVISPKRNARRKTSGGRAPDSKKLKDDVNIEDKSATKIQAGVRGFLVRRRNQKKRDNEEV